MVVVVVGALQRDASQQSPRSGKLARSRGGEGSASQQVAATCCGGRLLPSLPPNLPLGASMFPCVCGGGGWASELVSCVLGPLRELPRWHPNPVQRPLTHACLRRAFPSDGHRRCPFYTGTRSRVSHGECEKARG